MKQNYPPSYEEHQAREQEICSYNQWVKEKFPWYKRWALIATEPYGIMYSYSLYPWGRIIDFTNEKIVINACLDYRNSWFMEDLKLVLLLETREVIINWEYASAGY